MKSQPYSETGKFVEGLKAAGHNSTKGDGHPYSEYVPKHVRDSWKSLFSKQLYGIGKDILYGNNLLLRYGFTRQRPPAPDLGSSQYSLADRDDRIILWGFGMVFATGNDGLFLWRHEFEPKLLDASLLPSNIWAPEQLPECAVPETPDETLLTLRLLVKSVRWLEGYEKWIVSTCGQSYRGMSLRAPNSSGASSVCLDQKWSELGGKFEKILENSEPAQGRGVIEPEPARPGPAPTSAIPKKTCGACGESYPEDVRFCPSCGWEDLPC